MTPKKIIVKGKAAKVTSKGMHLLSICDARSDEAKKTENRIEAISANWRNLRDESLVVEVQAALALRNDLKKEYEFLKNHLLKIEKQMFDIWEEYRYLIQNLHKKFLKREAYVPNITTTVGRAVIARRLAGNNTYTGNVTHTALGSSSSAVAIGDPQLTAETYRKALSSGAFASNISYLETFYTATETSGTFREYGHFIDGTSSANSGQIFNHFLQTVTKSVTETLNVQSTITIADA